MSSLAEEVCRRVRGGAGGGEAGEAFENPSSSDVEPEDEGVLDVLAKFRGEQKECKFIVVTGEEMNLWACDWSKVYKY